MSDGTKPHLPAVSTRRAPPMEIGLPAQRGPDHSVTGVKSDCRQAGIMELSVPNLLPTDNASEVYEVPIHRLKIPVRINQVHIEVVDNGYVVKLPNAGRQHVMFGPDGSYQVFSGPDAKREMLEFVALVVGQVTYQYREVEADDYHRIVRRMEGKSNGADAEPADADVGPMSAGAESPG